MYITSNQLGIILFVLIVLFMFLISEIIRRNSMLDSKKKEIQKLEKENFKLNSSVDKLSPLQKLFDTLEVHSVLDAKEKLEEINHDIEESSIRRQGLRKNISKMESKRDWLIAEINEHEEKDRALEKKIENHDD